MVKRLIFFGIGFLISFTSFAQSGFSVELTEISVPNYPAIHSGAHAEFNGKWLFIGGRTNGLHGFHTNDGFPTENANAAIWVIDINSSTVNSTPTASLADTLEESINSSNMQYFQDGNTLYMVSGYGWKAAANRFETFQTLTAVDVQGLVNAVETNTDISPYFRQILDSNLAICGANLQKLGNSFYLVFGHRFDGTYSHNSIGNFYTQTYSNAVKKFNISDDGTTMSLIGFQIIEDTLNFHRRDYNLVPQIYPDGQEGFTAFSGVFQKGINIPYYTSIDLNSNGINHIPGFNQNLSQYHNAVMPLYDSAANAMHAVFFGGESMYRFDTVSNTLITDSLVPFVKTISCVSRHADSSLVESLLPITMPGFLGSNASFIPLPTIQKYANGVLKLDAINGRTLVGHIVGGIESPEANISATDPTLSFASSRIFEVYLNDIAVSAKEKTIEEPALLSLYPNPATDNITMEISTSKPENIEVLLLNSRGKIMETIFAKKAFLGKEILKRNLSNYNAGMYFSLLKTERFSRAYRFVVR